jgi:hypothetical protein
MTRATTVAIVTLLLYAAAILAHPTTITVADANAGNASTVEPALNFQPECGLLESFDDVIPPLLPPGWTAINAINPDGIFWQTSNSGQPIPPANSPPNAAWVNDPDTISDKYLYSPPKLIDFLSSADLHFSNNYALEDTFDGGVLEVSVDADHFKTFLQLAASLRGAVTMAPSAPVVAVHSLVARRGLATRVISSTLM